MVLIFIRTLSLHSAISYLTGEGYIEEETIEKEHDIYDKVFIYPYALYDENGRIVDRIGLFEYGNREKPPLDDTEDYDEDYDIVKMEWERMDI